jgi:hypothetical protein
VAVFDGSPEHFDRQLGLGLEHDLVGNVRFASTVRVLGPTLGQVQLEIDGSVRAPGRDAEAHADLAIADLADGAGVLSLHANRVFALFREARVVEDPRIDGRARGHRVDGMAGGESTHVAIAPLRVR